MRPLAVAVVAVALLILASLSLSILLGPDARNRPAAAPGPAADQLRLARLLGAGEDVEALRRLHGKFLEEGEPDWAETCVARILYFSPRDEWANREAGRFDLREIYARIPPVPDLDLYPNPGMERLRALEKAEIFWGNAEDRDYVEGLLASAVEHAIKLRGDPVYKDEWVWRTWMSRHPVFKEVRTVVGYRPPCLVFVQADRGAEGRAPEILERVSGLLSFLHVEFRRLFGERYGLPALPGEARGELRVAKTFVFADERTYKAYQALIHDPLAGGVQAHYRLDDQWIVLYEGGRAEKVAAAGEADVNTQKVLFTGVQQLLHLYRMIFVTEDSGEAPGWKDPRLISDLPWFETGFARFLASARRNEDGSWRLMATNRQILEELAKDDDLRGGSAVLLDMLERRRADLEGEDRFVDWDQDARWRFFLRAWSFCHFLWYYGDGEYRDALLDYLGEELHGRSGPAVFARCLSEDGRPDWARIESEWVAHVDGLLRTEGLR